MGDHVVGENGFNESSSSGRCKIVKLNVGGVRYTTTSATLLQHGDNYFSGLLSGKFSKLEDETGSYFIDRNGNHFAPILEYLRSGEVDIPKEMSRKAVLVEAKFFLVSGLMEILEEELKEPAENPPAPNFVNFDGDHRPVCSVRFDGFYADSTQKIAIAFLENGQIVSTVGENYIDSMIVFHQVWNIPTMWKQPELGRKYASFVHRFVRRGKYWGEGSALTLMLTQVEDESLLGVVANGGQDLYVMHAPPIFSKLKFIRWDPVPHPGSMENRGYAIL